MAYKKSRPRQDFDNGLTHISTTLRVASTSGIQPDVLELVLSSSVLLCSAKIESYTEDIFDKIADALSTSTIKVHKLPLELRTYLFGCNDPITSAYKRHVAFGEEKAFLKSMGNYLSTSTVASFSNHHSAIPRVSGNQICGKKKYPSPENIELLYNRLGIPNIFANLNKIGKRDVKLELDSFNSLRTALAHTGLGPTMNAADIQGHLSKMQGMIGLIDREISRHCIRWMGMAHWQNVAC